MVFIFDILSQLKTLLALECLRKLVHVVNFTLCRYEFFEKIDLSSFLEDTHQTQATYTLHAVLVHSGKSCGGQY